jgi:hypothetical protein
LVIGGVRAANNDPTITSTHPLTDEVELISLDPRNNPVPDQLRNMNRFPGIGISRGVGGALSTSGKNMYYQIESAGSKSLTGETSRLPHCAFGKGATVHVVRQKAHHTHLCPVYPLKAVHG